MDFDKGWNELLAAIVQKMGKQEFDMWFSQLRLLSQDGDRLQIEVPTKFHRDMIINRYESVLLDAVREVLHIDHPVIEFQPQQQALLRQAKPLKDDKKDRRDDKSGGLDQKYSFQNFVVGPSNQFAHAAAKAVAERPGKAYNPLFLYSGVGLGKTHLVKSIGYHVQSVTPRAKVMYLSSEQFTNDLINRMSHGSQSGSQRMEEFRQKYRNMDVLIIDDIQFLASKERTQEEFFHTFNALYEAQKQIVLTSDRQPKDIPDIEERLRSRFGWGLTADIQPPDLETRIAILKKKADVGGIKLPNDVAEFLASTMKSNIRELEGGLIKLGAVASLTGTEITMEMAKNELRDLLGPHEKIITSDLVQKIVAESFGVRVSDLRSKRRTKAVVLPRQMAMYLCRTLTSASLPEIGAVFGGKDHSTVIHACKVVEERKLKEPDFKNRLELLLKQITH